MEEDDSDYTSADSFESSDDGGVEGYENEDSDYESIADNEESHRRAEEPETVLPITEISTAPHKKKKKRRKLSIKNAFRRARNTNKILDDLRRLLEEAIQSNLLFGRSSGEIYCDYRNDPNDISLWGIPLLPSKGHHGTDVILLKFLRARDWKVPDAYDMLYRTLVWRRREKIDGILEENLTIGSLAEKMVFSDRTDREGRPLCFNVYGPLSDADFYKTVFGTEKSREEFIRWRIQCLERIISSKFKFKSGDTAESSGDMVSLVQISDLKNVPAKGVTELLSTGKKMLSIFQEHYPDIIFRNASSSSP